MKSAISQAGNAISRVGKLTKVKEEKSNFCFLHGCALVVFLFLDFVNSTVSATNKKHSAFFGMCVLSNMQWNPFNSRLAARRENNFSTGFKSKKRNSQVSIFYLGDRSHSFLTLETSFLMIFTSFSFDSLQGRSLSGVTKSGRQLLRSHELSAEVKGG